MTENGTTAKINLLETYKDSPLDAVNQLLISGAPFAPAPSKPLNGSVPLTELTPFERALYTISYNACEAGKTITQTIKSRALNPNPDELENDLFGYMKGTAALMDQAQAYMETITALDTIMWLNVKKRLSAMGVKWNAMEIQDDYQIVESTKDEEGSNKPDIGALLNSLSGLSSMMAASGVHQCETCEEYDSCDLSIKKPR